MCSYIVIRITIVMYWAIPFLSVQGYGYKNPEGLLIRIFSRALSQGIYFFARVKFAQLPFLEWETEIFFYMYHFFRGIESSKIRLQEVHESNNHSLQGILIFKNLFIHTPVWIKNGVAHYVPMYCHTYLPIICSKMTAMKAVAL